MPQYTFTIDPAVTSGSELATLLNTWKDAVHSTHLEATEPSYMIDGMVWAKQDTGKIIINLRASGQWHSILEVNEATGAVTLQGSNDFEKVYYGTATLAGNTFNVTITNAILETGTVLFLLLDTSTSTNVSISLNGGTAIPIQTHGHNVSLLKHDIVYGFVYNGTQFEKIGECLDELIRDYDITHTYEVGQYVVYDDCLYLCIVDTTAGILPTDISYFALKITGSQSTNNTSTSSGIAHPLTASEITALSPNTLFTIQDNITDSFEVTVNSNFSTVSTTTTSASGLPLLNYGTYSNIFTPPNTTSPFTIGEIGLSTKTSATNNLSAFINGGYNLTPYVSNYFYHSLTSTQKPTYVQSASNGSNLTATSFFDIPFKKEYNNFYHNWGYPTTASTVLGNIKNQFVATFILQTRARYQYSSSIGGITHLMHVPCDQEYIDATDFGNLHTPPEYFKNTWGASTGSVQWLAVEPETNSLSMIGFSGFNVSYNPSNLNKTTNEIFTTSGFASPFNIIRLLRIRGQFQMNGNNLEIQLDDAYLFKHALSLATGKANFEGTKDNAHFNLPPGYKPYLTGFTRLNQPVEIVRSTSTSRDAYAPHTLLEGGTIDYDKLYNLDHTTLPADDVSDCISMDSLKLQYTVASGINEGLYLKDKNGWIQEFKVASGIWGV